MPQVSWDSSCQFVLHFLLLKFSYSSLFKLPEMQEHPEEASTAALWHRPLLPAVLHARSQLSWRGLSQRWKDVQGLLYTYLFTRRDQCSLPSSMFLLLLLIFSFGGIYRSYRPVENHLKGLVVWPWKHYQVTRTNSISEIRLKSHILHNFTACISEVCSTFAHISSRFSPHS